MNSRQRRKLRRKVERRMEELSVFNVGGLPSPAKPMPWRLVLLLRASFKHFDALCARPFCEHGSRREGHLFRVLDDHREAYVGVRHRPNLDYFRRDNNWTPRRVAEAAC